MNQHVPSNQGTYEKNIQSSKDITLELIRRTDETIAALNKQIGEIAAQVAGFQLVNDQKVNITMLKERLESLKGQLVDAQTRRDSYKKDLEGLGFAVKK